MKRPNWKLYRLMIYIELGFIILCFIGIILLFLFLLDSTFPTFKYSLLCINIISILFSIVFCIGLIVITKYWRRMVLKSISNSSKIIYSLTCLTLSFSFLSSIEYLIYINNKDKFYIEKEYLQTSINDKIRNIKNEIAHSEKYMNSYIHILEELKNMECIKYRNLNDYFYTVIHDDTIEIAIHRKETIGGGGTIMPIDIDMGLNNAEDIGILLKNESCNMSHPTSKAILKSMQQDDSINGNDFRLLIHKKIEMYKDRIKEYKTILEDGIVITFGDFIIYSIFNPSITGNKTYIFIRLIFLLQAIVITFFSGYIYQTLYKILDGEDNKKPEA